ncbi:MAG: Hsp20/alpha crystallin family protein [Bifidobacteriaceae bacterium]|nr:Hsp20/alpha crystallin family protein [Bifidobacteriaceae bacterium]
MAMLPTVFGGNIFDDFFADPFFRTATNGQSSTRTLPQSLMNTDVRESDTAYTVDMDLPGYNKGDIQVDLNNGYLNVTAKRETDKDQKDDNGKYLRRERYYGTCTRSFYVGEDIKRDDIKATYTNGILSLSIPKKNAQEVEDSHRIAIEG